MNLRKHIWIILTVLFFIFPLKGRCDKLPSFEHFPTNDIGIYAVFRDADGILWLGTSQGLMTYAQLQSSFRSYSRLDKNLNNMITAIKQDNTGRLWLKTQALRYIIYDPRNNECISDVDVYLHGKGVNFDYQFYVYVDSKGRVWAFKDSIIYLIDFRTGHKKRFVLPASAGPVIKMTDDGRQIIVVAKNALYKSVFPAKSADEQISFGKWTSTPEPITKEDTYITLDGTGSLWMASNLKLMRYSTLEHQWKTFPEVKPDINGVLYLPNGQVCVSTTNTGLFFYDEQEHLRYNIRQTAPYLDGLQNSHLQSIYFDRQTSSLIISYHKKGLSMWSGNESSGIRQYHIQSATHDFIVEDVISFCAYGDNVLAGTEDDGVYNVTPNGILTWNKYDGNAVTAIMRDSSGKLWFGLYHGGLVCEDGRRYFENQSPYKIIETSPGRLFVVLNGDGVWVVDTNSGKTRQLPTDNPWILDMEENRGKIYAATPKALYIFNPQTLSQDTIDGSRFKNSGFNNGIKDLAVDNRGWVWLVNYKGNSPVDIYDTNNGQTLQVTALADYIVRAIAEDSEGNMWCTTNKGLVRVAVSKGSNPTFSLTLFADDKLFNDRAIYRLPNGSMVAGTTEGYEVFSPRVLMKSHEDRSADCPLILASLHINGNNILPGTTLDNKNIISSDLPYVHNIDLSYNENSIILEYLSKDLVAQDASTWSYKISGLNDSYIPMVNGRITLTNLSPGTYNVILHVGEPGTDTAHEYHVLTIHVERPWWISWWAIIIYIIIIGLLGMFVYRYRRRRTLYRQRILAVRERAKQQKALDDIKLKFFTNISHDLRTPLTLIITPIEELIDKAKDDETRNILKLIYRNAQRLFGLVNQILDFRKVDLAASQLHLESTDVVPLIRDITGSFSLMAKKNGQELIFTTSDDHIVAALDTDKISKVVMNLLSNAFKYAPKGGYVKVCVEKKDDTLTIAVADNGPSIPKEQLAHIFDRFYTTAANNGKHDSNGIGLNIVHDYIQLHHGKISVDNLEPQGAVFTIVLPITDASPVETEPQSSVRALPTTGKVGKHTGKTLLLVEDNTDLLGYLTHLLESEYNVCQATDGRQALEIINSTTVDIIVSDVMMDGMDGLELCRRVKNDIAISHIPIILLTAKALDSDQLKGLQMGADDYITKPFNADILRQRIRNMLLRTEQAHVHFSKDIDIKPSDITVTTLDEEFISKAIKIVEDNISNASFSVDDLANAIGMHRTNLYKKILAITGKTPLLFIRSLKLKRAHQLMSRGGVRVSQIAYEVGFNSPKNFARYFKEEYGMYPSEFVKQSEQATSGDNEKQDGEESMIK